MVSELCCDMSELKRSRLDLDVMKTQAEATNMEYDRLMKEHAQLQVRHVVVRRHRFTVNNCFMSQQVKN